MPLLTSIRMPRLRALLAVVLLAFAVGSIAHAAHTHDKSLASSAQHAACGYCFAFAAGADAPVPPRIALAPPTCVAARSVEPLAGATRAILLAAAPRGPPIS
jgi:hypothetical protein